MVFRNLLRRKLRTTFSVVGVGVGISLMVAMFTMSGDMLGQIRSLLQSERGDLVAIQAGRNILTSELVLSSETGGEGFLERLRSEPNVAGAWPMVWSYMTTEQRIGVASELDYYGMTEQCPALRKFEVVEHSAPGEPLIRDDDPHGFIVGKRLFDLVNTILPPDRRLKVGQKLDLGKLLLDELSDYFVPAGGKAWKDMTPEERQEFSIRRLKSSGVNPVAAAGMRDLYLRAVYRASQPVMEAAIVFPLVRAQALKDMAGRATVVLIELKDNSDSAKDAAVAALDGRFAEIRFLRADKADQEYTEYIELFENMTWAISLIAALAGALGVLNMMVLSVHERTSEIGLLLAVGWSRWRVMRMILLEGIVITVLGGVLGVLLGLAEMAAVKQMFNLIFLTPRIDPVMSAVALGLCAGLGLAAGMYPAWRASRMSPMDALRHE